MARAKDNSRRQFIDEESARQHIQDRLATSFQFWPQVKAVDAIGNPFTIDAVSKCKVDGYFVGWEFKRSHLYKSEFANVLRQALYYSLATINDPRLSDLQGMNLHCVIAFPDWDGLHDEDDVTYEQEASGMRLLAGHFGVGVARETKPGRLSFILGEGAIWHEGHGWNGNASGVLLGKRGLAAVRKLRPNLAPTSHKES